MKINSQIKKPHLKMIPIYKFYPRIFFPVSVERLKILLCKVSSQRILTASISQGQVTLSGSSYPPDGNGRETRGRIRLKQELPEELPEERKFG